MESGQITQIAHTWALQMRGLLVRFVWMLVLGGSFSAIAQTEEIPTPAPTPACDAFATEVFKALFESEDQLFDFFIELDAYQLWIDQTDMAPEKKDQMKLHALGNYRAIRKSFKKESRRITKLFRDFERSGGQLVLDSCAFRPNKEIATLGTMTCYYSGTIDKSAVKDAIWFEVVFDGVRFRIVDGFFDPI
jgi:hypothetical protein